MQKVVLLLILDDSYKLSASHHKQMLIVYLNYIFQRKKTKPKPSSSVKPISQHFSKRRSEPLAYKCILKSIVTVDNENFGLFYAFKKSEVLSFL